MSCLKTLWPIYNGPEEKRSFVMPLAANSDFSYHSYRPARTKPMSRTSATKSCRRSKNRPSGTRPMRCWLTWHAFHEIPNRLESESARRRRSILAQCSARYACEDHEGNCNDRSCLED